MCKKALMKKTRGKKWLINVYFSFGFFFNWLSKKFLIFTLHIFMRIEAELKKNKLRQWNVKDRFQLSAGANLETLIKIFLRNHHF